MSKEEAKLIQRAKRGDPTAFAEIYDRYQPAIFRYISCRVSDVAIAEDLTSEVFVHLVESIDGFTYQGRPLLAWLYTIARNLVTDHYRSAGRDSTVPLHEGLTDDSPNPGEAAEHALDQQRLSAALAHLTEEQRQVILLKFFEGLDNESIAQILGKSYGAVKSLQHRALEALRRILKSDES